MSFLIPKKRLVIVEEECTLNNALKASGNEKLKEQGHIFILNNKQELTGILTDGDIRRALVNYGKDLLAKKIKDLSNEKYIFLDELAKPKIMISRINQMQIKHNKHGIKLIPLIDKEKKLISAVCFQSLLNEQITNISSVSIIGLGYVGITLFAAFSSHGFKTQGIDIDQSKIRELRKGQYLSDEPGVTEALKSAQVNGNVLFCEPHELISTDVYVICVGTSLDKNMNLDTLQMQSCLESLSKVLKPGQQVHLRSTVPVGFTREYVAKKIFEFTNLEAGKDFNLAFAPERTIEGNALQEIYSLPQIIGGLSDSCLKNGASFWESINNKVITLENLESAELCKLANNSFRDLSFAFSNQLALLSEKFNIDINSTISSANEGYPRNPIALPSPGVGGYCLTKDPLLLKQSCKESIKLSSIGREINDLASLAPMRMLKKWSTKKKIKISKLKVAILGIAFKGNPANCDTRLSPSETIVKELKILKSELYLYDWAIDKGSFYEKLVIDSPENLIKNIINFDAIIIMNNHLNNKRIDFTNVLSSKKDFFLFDGWRQLSIYKKYTNNNFTYATMGYIS